MKIVIRKNVKLLNNSFMNMWQSI